MTVHLQRPFGEQDADVGSREFLGYPTLCGNYVSNIAIVGYAEGLGYKRFMLCPACRDTALAAEVERELLAAAKRAAVKCTHCKDLGYVEDATGKGYPCPICRGWQR